MGIRLNNVSFAYDSEYIFNKLNLEISNNSITGVIGKSGSGKTTFLNLISGLEKPNKGKITYDDLDIERSDIGYIFQNLEDNFLSIYVKDELEVSLKNYNINKDLNHALKMIGLKEDILSKKISELTNGEKRLIAILSVLVYNPKIILFDEPTTGLDYKNKKKVISLIKTLKNKYEKTIIIVSHDVDLLYELCDNLILISNGKIILYGDPISVYEEINLINEYDIPIPKVVLFENLVRKKKIKLLKSRNANDLIKEVYRNV